MGFGHPVAVVRPLLWTLGAALAASGVLADQDVAVTADLAKDLIRDQRESSSAPDLGYAGSMLELGPAVADWIFVKDRRRSAEILRAGGARLVKEWHANGNWEKGLAPGSRFPNPDAWFSFRQEEGMKVLLCLECRSAPADPAKGTRTTDIAVVKRSILAYLKWIIDHGYKGQVAGFELGNEPYFGTDAEDYAARWAEIVPAMKEMWPEAKIGFSVAEYRAGDPDVAAVRRRFTDVDKWFDGPDSEFGFRRINQWSGRFVQAFSNYLHLTSHVVYHFYGADGPYGCSPTGFGRAHDFARVFPEVKDKRIWITEWRERSDEDNRCHQKFTSAMWKAHYLLAVLAQPDIDGICNHCIGSLSGGFAVSDGREWIVQWDSAGRNYPDLDGVGHPHFELGPSGRLFGLYTAALEKHPLILRHGTDRPLKGPGDDGLNAIQYYTNGSYQPPDGGYGALEWIVLANPEKTSVAVLFANSRHQAIPVRLDLGRGIAFGRKSVRSVRCRPDRIYKRVIPGEPKPWTYSEETLDPSADGSCAWSVPPDGFSTLVVTCTGKVGRK